MAGRIKYYLDEHSANAVAAGLRRRGVDVRTTHEGGQLGAADEAQLAYARQEGRVLFTQDEDFLRLHALGVSHAGIVYVRQGTQVGDIIRGLMLIYEVLEEKEMRDHVEFL